MRIHVLIVIAALPSTPFRVSPATLPQAGHEACRITQDGLATGPSADVCAQVQRRWSLLIPGSIEPGSIQLEQREGFAGRDVNGQWTLMWPLPTRAPARDQQRRADGLARYFAESTIPHEAGHLVFSAYSRRSGLALTSNGYMSVAPDWFDEAPPVWMESKASREKRMLSVVRTTPSLARLATLQHPANAAQRDSMFGSDFTVAVQTTMPPCPKCTFLPDSLRAKYRVTATGTHRNGRADTITRYFDEDPAGASFEEKNFYPLAYALLRFIHMRGGSAAVVELLNRYRKNPMRGADALAGLPGLPPTESAFENAWHKFLSAPPPEAD